MSHALDSLAQSGLFAGLSDDERLRLVRIGRIEYYAAGAMVLAEGEQGPRMLVVVEGEVEVLRTGTSGQPVSMGRLGSGEVLGEISLLLDMPRSATVVATEDLKCFSVDRSSFQELVDAGDPAALKLGLALARSLASRLIKLNDRVVDMLADDGRQQQFSQQRQALFRLWS